MPIGRFRSPMPCLIRCAEIHDEPRVFSFDSDFRVYRWARNRKFDLVR
jgi:hypothetical protein